VIVKVDGVEFVLVFLPIPELLQEIADLLRSIGYLVVVGQEHAHHAPDKGSRNEHGEPPIIFKYR
jgi:hypothetical protein